MLLKTKQNLACFFGGLSLIFFTIVIIVKVKYNHMNDQLINDQVTLKEQTALSWAQYPGINNLTINKTFTLFSYANTPTKPMENQQQLEEAGSFSYNYSFIYENLTLVPGTGGGISYYENYSYSNMFQASKQQDPNKVDIMTINLGLFVNYHDEVNSSPARKLPILLNQVQQSIQQTLPIWFAYTIQQFQLQNFNFVNQLIFIPSGLSANQAQTLWSDPSYGWQNNLTFSNWVAIPLSTIGSAHDNYNLLMNYFNFNDDIMNGLIGDQSIVNNLIKLLNVSISSYVLSQNSQCSGMGSYTYCTDSELTSLQWGNCTLTQGNYFPTGPQFYYSFYQLNQTLHPTTEIPYFVSAKSQYTTNITLNDSILYFANTPDGEVNDIMNQKSLISPLHIAQIFSNIQYPGLVGQYLDSSQPQQIPVIIDYLWFFLDNVAIRSDSYKTANNETITIVLFAYQQMLQIIDNITQVVNDNLYSRGMFNNLTKSNKQCPNLLNNETLQPAIPNVCKNQKYDPTLNFQNNIIWVEAFQQGPQSPPWMQITQDLQLSDDQLQMFLFDTADSYYAQTLDALFTAVKIQYKCPTYVKYCTQQYLGIKQWAQQGVTTNLPQPFFTAQDNVNSVSQWNQTVFNQQIIIELSLYAQQAYKYSLQLNDGVVNSLINYQTGNKGNIKIFNEMNIFILSIINQIDTQARFAVSLNDAQMILNYFKQLIVENVFGGIYRNFTAQEVLWGFQDSYLAKKKSEKLLFGGQPWIDTKIQFFNQTNLGEIDQLTNYDLNQLNTGSVEEDQSRQLMKYYGNQVVQIKQLIYQDKDQSIYLTTNPYNQAVAVKGTNGFAFKPNNLDGDDIYIFEQDLLRPLKLNKTISLIQNDYELYYYVISDSEFNPSQVYGNQYQGFINVDYFSVSKPYFYGVNTQFCSNIIIDNQECANYQQNKGFQGSFYVEPNTGFTTSIQKQFMYSINVQNGLLIDQGGVKGNYFIPIFISSTEMSYPQQLMSDLFSQLQSNISTCNTLFITFLVLGCVTAVSAIIFIVLIILEKRKKVSNSVDDEQHQGVSLQKGLVNKYTEDRPTFD